MKEESNAEDELRARLKVAAAFVARAVRSEQEAGAKSKPGREFALRALLELVREQTPNGQDPDPSAR